MIILETPRLVLRHMHMGDMDALCALYQDPDVRRYFPDGILTCEDSREELEWFLNAYVEFPQLGLWATVERSSGAFLGRCGLFRWEIEGKHEIELAYLIDKTRWSEGFASEAGHAIVQHAKNKLGLKRLISLIHPENTASIRVAEKVGMAFERHYTHPEFGQCLIYSQSLG